jgi:hypothetical protein
VNCTKLRWDTSGEAERGGEGRTQRGEDTVRGGHREGKTVRGGHSDIQRQSVVEKMRE